MLYSSERHNNFNIDKRNSSRQPIPLLLRLKRFKSSGFVRRLNEFLSKIKPPRKLNSVPKKMLLFRNDRIGDAMVTLPVIRDIKHNYHDIEIDVITSPNNNFIFEDFESIDNVIPLRINGNETGFFHKLPLIGGFMLFVKYLLLPFLFSGKFRKTLKFMTERRYDYAADLVGLKRNAIIASYVSAFTAGPGRLLPFMFYDYYSDSNWVTAGDKDFMTRKIEKFITESTGMLLAQKNTNIPLIKIEPHSSAGEKKTDIIFHFGTSSLRKLGIEKEKKLISDLKNMSIIVTDSGETETFGLLRSEFKDHKNIQFKLYKKFKDLAEKCLEAKLLVCYDGGQVHYLSQFIQTVAIFGPGSAALWKPYEFADYEYADSDSSGACAIGSKGKKKHIAIYRPMWCNPCFDTGCKTKPCLGDISAGFITRIIKENCLQN